MAAIQMTRAQWMVACGTTPPPDWSTFMYNLLFRYDVLDTASSTAGHVKKETNTRAFERSLPHTDGHVRTLQSFQLPLIRLMVGGVSTEQGIVAGVALTGRGLKMTPTMETLGGGEQRMDFLLENISIPYNTDTYITIAETVVNSGNYNFNINPTHLGKIKLADPTSTYDFIGNLFGATPSLKLTGLNEINVNTLVSNSISWTHGVGGLQADVVLDGTSLVIGGGGLSLNNPTTYVMTTGDQNIAGIKNFTTTPVCANIPAGVTELTNKLYVDTADLLAAHLAHNETIAGNWTFTNNVIVPLVPVLTTHATSKQYVDNLVTTYISAIQDTGWVTMDNAWCLASNTGVPPGTYFPLLAAPPAGYYIDIVTVLGYMKYGGVTFTLAGADLVEIQYTNGTIAATFPHTFAEAAADMHMEGNRATYLTKILNNGLQVRTTTSDMAAGTGEMHFRVFYRHILPA